MARYWAHYPSRIPTITTDTHPRHFWALAFAGPVYACCAVALAVVAVTALLPWHRR